ncbi:hypothetical protein [Novosphingobium colocasiae]|uniref:hypothetical protein n=1 Tax=Novosphingobium colocasiae TaxID=1256513 RepID=UPI0035B3CD8E
MATSEGGGDGAGAAELGELLGGAAGTGDAGAGGGGDAGIGDGGAGGGSEPALGADPDWWGTLSGDAEGENASHRDWVKATGVKDVNGLVKIARDNQTALRDSGRVKVPGEGASAEDVAAFHRAIGVPETVEGYTLPEVKDAAGNVIPLDQGLLGKLLSKALGHGVPAAAMNGVIADFVQLQMDDAAQFDNDLKAAAQEWVKGQGSASTAKQAAISTAARTLGLSSTELIAVRNALAANAIDQGGKAGDGVAKALNLFARIGEGMAEDTIITGGSNRFAVTGSEAQGQLDAMKVQAGKDPAFAKAVGTPGTPENARWTRLQDQAANWKVQNSLAG